MVPSSVLRASISPVLILHWCSPTQSTKALPRRIKQKRKCSLPTKFDNTYPSVNILNSLAPPLRPHVELEVYRRQSIYGNPSDVYEAGPDVLIRENGRARRGYVRQYTSNHPTFNDSGETILEVVDEDNNTWRFEHRSEFGWPANQDNRCYGRVQVAPARQRHIPTYEPTGSITTNTWNDYWSPGEATTTSATTYERNYANNEYLLSSATATISYRTHDTWIEDEMVQRCRAHDAWIEGEMVQRYNNRPPIEAWQILAPPRVSDEERARWAERDRQHLEARRQQEEERRAAEGRAERLLLALLTPEQRDDYKNKRCFYTQVNGQHFRIDFGTTNNVKRIDPVTKRVIEGLCIHPSFRHGCPTPDVLVAQKLMLETQPERFMQIANHNLN